MQLGFRHVVGLVELLKAFRFLKQILVHFRAPSKVLKEFNFERSRDLLLTVRLRNFSVHLLDAESTAAFCRVLVVIGVDILGLFLGELIFLKPRLIPQVHLLSLAIELL